ncbi:PIN domain-containing protein (plasmid) [Robbsia andropogonis]|uniref:PIN domain-containing protein n=1 Tax=Robbsia andropogonis TaxID=28092 RepID=UPI003D1A04A9
MRFGHDRFIVVLDACVLFPMLVRDVLLTFAQHELFIPRWSDAIHDEWQRNLAARLAQQTTPAKAVDQTARIRSAMERAFPDANVRSIQLKSDSFEEVDAKDRHVVMTAIASRADAVVTFNLRDFAVEVVRDRFGIEVLHPDEFICDLIDLQEKRAIAVFRELRNRRKNPPITVEQLIESVRRVGLLHVANWLSSDDVFPLL